MKILDSHNHFWVYDETQYAWIDEQMAVLKRDYLPDELAELQSAFDVEGTIVVQARQDVAETKWLLELAQARDTVLGVIGWVDLCADDVGQQLETLAQNLKLVGLRHIVQAEPKGFMLRPTFLNGIAQLEPFDLAYDILIYEHQLEEAIELVKRFLGQTFVLDHIAKPNMYGEMTEQWKQGIRTIAQYPNVYCKLSGMVTEADWSQWSYEQLLPYMYVVYEAFGSDRLMFGSDWPVCLLAGSYRQVLELVQRFSMQLSDKEKRQLFELTAMTAYKLNN